MIQYRQTRHLPTDLFDNMLLGNSNFKVNVYQQSNNYTITAELPGFNKEDINIEYDNNILTISAERSDNEATENEQQYLIRERNTKKQSRQFIFKHIDTTNINATMEDGMLIVNLPMKQSKTQINID
ncbi:Hsp20 family protein [Staphylococcus gallinarum]|jgi:HSP20 family protein|uniref:Heat-shock protein n=1 Tax=Staphylococcus gallinarum TaxID=1293 RepID=A0A0D0SLZ7_STAGA|nr:Hsp20 family protein [Staphylococcus gallinarum]KIR11228.1 heat-shock protein [Staphylococcus gallinarum]MCD8785095.1 Hsp20 family protein [Staphylococcus gallinarum]MCD8821421.1 Hsp20 family protein [Staphylococcus gallinarum]MCD8826940.1 Hsp20 family protein [Staphylococcus gallinarum]MCD8857804.1 Hsp20 family protein [Staphylococcus gallinarum]